MPDKKKVLVVEDEEMLSTMYKVKFENDGYDVSVANNGADGLEMAAKVVPDLILLDIIMPKIDGFAVLKKLKEDPKTAVLPVVMLTNLTEESVVQESLHLGAVGYLVKVKYTPPQVVEKVKDFIKFHQQHLQ